MDGENNGQPYEQMDDLGGKHPYFWFNTPDAQTSKATSAISYKNSRPNMLVISWPFGLMALTPCFGHCVGISDWVMLQK